jgi:hypothetical protein
MAAPSRFHQIGGAMDRAAKPFISSATADIGDVRIDLSVGRIRVLFEK